MFIEINLRQLYKHNFFRKNEKYECDYNLKNASRKKINECLENEMNEYIESLAYEWNESEFVGITIKFTDENGKILGQKVVKI